jgi:hypothetical protein
MTIIERPDGSYKVWPFRSDFEGERTNIGGVDLVKEPHRIDEIHELNQMPKLKKEVLAINTESTNFMTLGCWLEKTPDLENVLDSYIEFCFRPDIDTSKVDMINLDHLFYRFIQDKLDEEARKMMESRLDWVYHYTKLYGEEPYVMVYHVTVEAYTPEDIESFFVPLLVWLRKYFELPTS